MSFIPRAYTIARCPRYWGKPQDVVILRRREILDPPCTAHELADLLDHRDVVIPGDSLAPAQLRLVEGQPAQDLAGRRAAPLREIHRRPSHPSPDLVHALRTRHHGPEHTSRGVQCRELRYEIRLGLRYLYGGKSGRALFSVFTNISMLGVALGVAALTIVLAVTTGFQKEFRDKVLGVNAHISITESDLGFPEYRDVIATARAIDPEVIGAEPFIFAEMLATRGKGELSGVAIKGVDPDHVGEVLDLAKAMQQGSLDALKQTGGATPPLLIGIELAHKLKAKLGDTITLVSPLANLDPATGRTKGGPHTRAFRVAGIFYSGFDEYDRRLVYASLVDAQSLLGLGDVARGVELKIKDVDRADEIAENLEHKLGGMYEVQGWYALNHNLFTALNLQKLVLVIILTLIIIVAAVNMVSALTMMVTDKTREIAILKSMGASNASIAFVFQVVGIAIGGVGTIIGVLIGLGIAYFLGSYAYGLDPKVYLIDHLPIEVRPTEVLIVAGITMVISVIATVFPARSASSLQPVDGLRYD